MRAFARHCGRVSSTHQLLSCAAMGLGCYAAADRRPLATRMRGQGTSMARLARVTVLLVFVTRASASRRAWQRGSFTARRSLRSEHRTFRSSGARRAASGMSAPLPGYLFGLHPRAHWAKRAERGDRPCGVPAFRLRSYSVREAPPRWGRRRIVFRHRGRDSLVQPSIRIGSW